MNTHFNADYFSVQLKKAQIFRGYEKQADICRRYGISRQAWSLWELGKRYPGIKQLILLANLLQLDISYFFLEGVEPGEFTL